MENIVSSIIAIVEQMEVKTQEQFVIAVLDRLSFFGYEASCNDDWLIAFCIQKVINHIMNSCNTNYLPNGLFFVAVDRVCGEFLYSINSSGKLELDNIDLSGSIKEIVEGDITLKFSDASSDAEKFSILVDYLKNEGASDEICYRKLKW